MELAIVQEGDECSVYEMRNGTRTVRLTFEVEADDRYLPVSLASMISKYIRELLMDRMNLYFAKLDAGSEADGGILAGRPAVRRGTADPAAPPGGSTTSD